ncbi:MAG: hypothetical protein ACOCWH_06000 [Spirochaetota bacterium]
MNQKQIFHKIWYLVLIMFLVTGILPAQEEAQPADDDVPETQPSDLGSNWRTEDFQPYVKAIDDLKKLSEEYSENILTQSIDEYSTGMDILRDMDATLSNMQKAFDNQNNLNERWYWQEIDRSNQLKRRKALLKYESKLKAITYFTRSINHLDSIQNENVRKDDKFINFKIKLFRAYVSTQYDVHNLKPCIPILERYVAINSETKNDVQAYKYLASCYAYMETSLDKYNSSISEETRIQYKQKKNQALLTAAELEYGIDSVYYRKLQDIVDLDEKKSEKINDFR